MTIITDTYLPYEYEHIRDVVKHIKSLCSNIKARCVRLIDKKTDCLTIRLPVSGDYLDIIGTEQELKELHAELIRIQLYRPF